MHKANDFVVNACVNWEPVQISKNMAHMVTMSKYLQEPGSIILYQLQAMELALRAPREKGVVLIQARRDTGVYQLCAGVVVDAVADLSNAAKMHGSMRGV